MLAPALALLGAALLGADAHAAGAPQQTASVGPGKPAGVASDALVGRGLEQLGQQALIRVPDPARPCRFDIQMERQDGRQAAWESFDLCHAPEPRLPRAFGAVKTGQ